MRIFYALFALTLCLSAFHRLPAQVDLTTFDTGYTEPLFLTHAGDARLFIVEKAGIIKITDQQGNVNGTPFLNIDPRVNSAASERGLLGLAFHPDYKQNGYFYVNYTNSGGHTVVSRFSVTANPDIADPNSEVILLTINQPYSNHNGGCIMFGRDGYLYIGMGDGGSGGDPQNYAQSTTSLLGKMLRIDVDGPGLYGIPANNPYQGLDPIPDEIWGFGVRNPWRFSFDLANGDLWMGEVGQDNWEEIDYLAYNADPAPNWGWRCYEGNAPYNTAGCQAQTAYDPPIYQYANSGSSGCSVTGGYIYRGGRYASLYGTYFHTDYCTGYLWETVSNGMGGFTTTRGDQYNSFDLVSFGEDVYGQIYVLGISSGTIFKITDTTNEPVAAIFADSNITVCDNSVDLFAAAHPDLSYQWQRNGVDVPGADTSFLNVTGPGTYRIIVQHAGLRDTSSTVTVNFSTPPTITITPVGPFCQFDPPINLSAAPLGGSFYGASLMGIVFDPAQANLGSNMVYYSYDAGYGCAALDSLDIQVSVCPGFAEADRLQDFKLYPVPAQNRINFSFMNEHPGEIQWSISDVHGRDLIQGHSGEALGGEFRSSCDVSALSTGIYMLYLQVEGVHYAKSFSLQR